jgi:hypothetical protein
MPSMQHDLVASTLLFGLAALALGALPFVPLALLSRAINTFQDARLPWTPTVELAALAIGAAAGALALRATLDPASLTASEIFRKGGPWDLSIPQFLAGPGNPLLYTWDAVLPWRLRPPAGVSVGLVVALFAGLVVYVPAIIYRSSRGVAHGLRNAVIVVWGALAAVYLFAYLLWLANELNFWLFLILLIIIQKMRKRSERPIIRIG